MLPRHRRPMWFGHRIRLGWLGAWSLLCLTPPLLDAAAAPDTPSWADVLKPQGDLTFVRKLTNFALTCPTGDFEKTLGHGNELPAERRAWSQGLLAEAWMDREPADALVYWRKHRADLAPEVQQIFYRKLALTDLPQAEDELEKEKSTAAVQIYKQAIVEAVAPSNPAAVLPLARSLDGDSGWVMVQVIASLAKTDREKAFAEARKITAVETKNAAFSSVIQSWFETQPAEALRWAAEHLPAEQTESIATTLIGSLAQKNFPQAQRLAAELNLPAVNKALESALGALPPKQLCEKAISSGWGGIPDYALSGMIKYASKQSPSEAIRFFKSVPAERLKDESDAKEIATAWTLLEPQAVQIWAAALPDESMRREVLLRINSMLTEMDPKLALAQIEATPKGPLQAQMVNNTAKAFGKKDLPGALAWVTGLPAGPNQDKALAGLAFIGADYNPAAMAKGLAAMPESPAKKKACKEFADLWLKNDVGAVLNWFTALPVGPERVAVQSNVFEAAAQYAPDDALALVQTMANRDEQAALVQKLANRLALEDPAAALALAEALPDAAKRNALSASVLSQLAREHPEQAAKLTQGLDFGRKRGAVLASIASRWAAASPAAATAWLDSLRQDPSLQADLPRISTQIAQSWANQNLDQALAWVQRMPAGKEHDQALAGVATASELTRLFPQKAFDLLANDPILSKDAGKLSDIARRWFETQPTLAARHIAASNLPEPIKKKLLAQNSPH